MTLGCRQAGPRRENGKPSLQAAVLLEVLLALALFVFAATVITSSVNVGVTRVARLRAQLHALDLAASVLSEVKLGMISASSTGPEPFQAPFDKWTWEVQAQRYSYGTKGASGLQLVTVIVKNDARTAAQRLTEMVALPADSGGLDALGGTPDNSATLAPAAANNRFVP